VLAQFPRASADPLVSAPARVLTKTEGVAMNRHSWAWGFVLLAAISANAQRIREISSENLRFVELLRRAEAGDKYAQHKLGIKYLAGTGTERNYPEALKLVHPGCKLRESWRRIAPWGTSMSSEMWSNGIPRRQPDCLVQRRSMTL